MSPPAPASDSDGHDEKDRAPASVGGEPAAERGAERHRDGDAAGDDGDRRAAPLGRGDGHRYGVRRRHVGRGRHREHGVRQQEDGQGRRKRCQQVAGGEPRKACPEQPLAIHAAGQRRQDGRADGIGEREHGHHLAGRPDGRAEVAGDARQQAGDDEAVGADGERADRQPGETSEHGFRLLFKERWTNEHPGRRRVKRKFNDCWTLKSGARPANSGTCARLCTRTVARSCCRPSSTR